jgi:hypothetical protein
MGLGWDMTPQPTPRKKREKMRRPRFTEAACTTAPMIVRMKARTRAFFRPQRLEKGATIRKPRILPEGSMALIAPSLALAGWL